MTWSWPAFGLGALVGAVLVVALGAAAVHLADGAPKLRVLDGGKAPPRPQPPPAAPPEPEAT